MIETGSNHTAFRSYRICSLSFCFLIVSSHRYTGHRAHCTLEKKNSSNVATVQDFSSTPQPVFSPLAGVCMHILSYAKTRNIHYRDIPKSENSLSLAIDTRTHSLEIMEIFLVADRCPVEACNLFLANPSRCNRNFQLHRFAFRWRIFSATSPLYPHYTA